MKIALVAPVMIPVPPLKYGGIERVLDTLAHGLAAKGHEVTIYCAGGSTIAGDRIHRKEISPYPTIPDYQDETRRWEINELCTVVAEQHLYDLVHFMYEPIILQLQVEGTMLEMLRHMSVPCTLAFRNLTDIPEHQTYYQEALWLHGYPAVFISNKQCSHLPWFTHARVIPNGVPLDRYPFQVEKEPYMLFLGRITRNKGILESLAVARRTNVPLVIAARLDHADRSFYEEEVRPHIDGKFVRFVGEVGFEEKVDLLKRAQCMLFPILWEEAFGNVMIESMACGTPVIGFRRGAVPEVIVHESTGYVVDTLDEMVHAVGRVCEIDPHVCREHIKRYFSVEMMVDRYEAFFMHAYTQGAQTR